MANRLDDLGMGHLDVDSWLDTLRSAAAPDDNREFFDAFDQLKLVLALLLELPTPRLIIQRQVTATLELTEVEVSQAANQMDILGKIRLLRRVVKAIGEDAEGCGKVRQLVGEDGWDELAQLMDRFAALLVDTAPPNPEYTP